MSMPTYHQRPGNRRSPACRSSSSGRRVPPRPRSSSTPSTAAACRTACCSWSTPTRHLPRRPSRPRQDHGRRPAHRLCLPEHDLLAAGHQSGRAVADAAAAAARAGQAGTGGNRPAGGAQLTRPGPMAVAPRRQRGKLVLQQRGKDSTWPAQDITIDGPDGSFGGYLAHPGRRPRPRRGRHPGDFRRQPGHARCRRRLRGARLFRPGAGSVLAARAGRPAHRQDRCRMEAAPST